MRILLVSALLIAMASCAFPPPPGEMAAAPLPLAPGVAAAPMPPPAAAPAVFWPVPFAWLFAPVLPATPWRLTLSNFSFGAARVQAVLTPYPDCAARADTPTTDFVLPLNGTRIIEAAAGADVCWRREIPPGQAQSDRSGPAPVAGWTEWNRVFLSSGRPVDARL